MLAWLAFVIAPFPEFDPWKAKERWSDLPTFENIVKECMLSYDHFFDFDRVEELVLNHANASDALKADDQGRTILHWLCFSDEDAPTLVEHMLSLGAEVDAVDKEGNTPLLDCAYQGRVDGARVLLEHGADVEWRNKYNHNASIYARSELYNGLGMMIEAWPGAATAAAREALYNTSLMVDKERRKKHKYLGQGSDAARYAQGKRGREASTRFPDMYTEYDAWNPDHPDPPEPIPLPRSHYADARMVLPDTFHEALQYDTEFRDEFRDDWKEEL